MVIGRQNASSPSSQVLQSSKHTDMYKYNKTATILEIEENANGSILEGSYKHWTHFIVILILL